MSLSRLRTGELLAGAGAAGLFALLFLDWFESTTVGIGAGFRPIDALHTTGWGSLGWFLVAMLVVLIVAATALVVTTARGGPVALPVAAGVLTALFGMLCFLVLLLRVLTQPGLGVDAPNHLVDIRPAAYLGLLATLGTAAGAWVSIADERTDAAGSAYTPPPARPAPPPEPEAEAAPGS
jgi:hypothetical protein